MDHIATLGATPIADLADATKRTLAKATVSDLEDVLTIGLTPPATPPPTVESTGVLENAAPAVYAFHVLERLGQENPAMVEAFLNTDSVRERLRAAGQRCMDAINENCLEARVPANPHDIAWLSGMARVYFEPKEESGRQRYLGDVLGRGIASLADMATTDNWVAAVMVDAARTLARLAFRIAGRGNRLPVTGFIGPDARRGLVAAFDRMLGPAPHPMVFLLVHPAAIDLWLTMGPTDLLFGYGHYVAGTERWRRVVDLCKTILNARQLPLHPMAPSNELPFYMMRFRRTALVLLRSMLVAARGHWPDATGAVLEDLPVMALADLLDSIIENERPEVHPGVDLLPFIPLLAKDRGGVFPDADRLPSLRIACTLARLYVAGKATNPDTARLYLGSIGTDAVRAFDDTLLKEGK